MKKKPNFLIIGAAKSGTTTLHAMLKKHPDVFLAEEKDFKFFDVDENYRKGWDWYERYFKKYTGQKIIGEANSEYLFSKEAAERIKRDLGEGVKLLAIIRNPVDRSFSEFLHQERYGKVDKSIDHYIKGENLEFDQDKNDLYRTIVGRSFYSKHLKNYFEVFPSGNLKVVVLEKLMKEPKREMNGICSFLGIKTIEVEQLEQANKAYSPKITWLNDLVLQPNKFLKILIPSFSLRQKLRAWLQNLNSKKKIGKKEIALKHKEKLKAIFKGEKQRLEKILNISLEEWD